MGMSDLNRPRCPKWVRVCLNGLGCLMGQSDPEWARHV